MNIHQRIAIGVCLALTLCFDVFATDYRVYNLKGMDGVNCTYVRDMAQDSTGYLWLANINGLCCYDGYHMKNIINLADKSQDIILDNRTVNVSLWGSRFLWVKLRGNIFACYDLNRGRFVNYTGDERHCDVFRQGLFSNPDRAWLYGGNIGCRQVRYRDNVFTATDYTVQNGHLPSNQVNFISYGLQGRTWIGTDKGLVLFSGDRPVVLLRDGDIRGMEVVNGKEYIVTRDARVYLYHQGKLQQQGNPPSGMPIQVTDVVGIKGMLYLLAADGVYEYSTVAKSLVKSQQLTIANGRLISTGRGSCLLYDRQGHMAFFDMKRQQVQSISLPTPLSLTTVHAVVTEAGQLWIACYSLGLYIYDLFTGDLQHFTGKQGEGGVINTNNLLDILEDRNGDIWVSQEDLGLVCIKPMTNVIDRVLPGTGALGNQIRTLWFQQPNLLYMANMEGHMYIADDLKNVKPAGWYEGGVMCIATDIHGTKWIGTRAGLVVGDRHYRHDDHDASSLSSNKISAIHSDRKGRMWIAAFGGGLDVATVPASATTPAASPAGPFRHFFTSLSDESRQTRVITGDHRGRLWVGTGEGILLFYPDRLLKNEKDYRQLNVNRNPKMDEVHAIYEDSLHRVWVCLTGSGVALYDNSGEQPKLERLFTTRDGLGDDRTQSVVEDAQGRIWIGTNYGVSTYDEDTRQFTNQLMTDDIYGNVCMEGAACLLPNGMLLFGTKAGALRINPENTEYYLPYRYLSLTDIHINGIAASDLSEEIVLENAPSRLKHLTLSHDQNSLTFYFSDFVFGENKTNRYTYILEGDDKEWSVPSTLNFATYKNLAPGHYIFRLRAFNEQGVENDSEVDIDITIRPPWWNTWWAWLFYLFFLSAIVWAVWRQWRHNEELRTKIKIENQLTEYKLQFFTNISHEFRTPLTIIQGAMDRILTTDNMPGTMKQPVSAMHKSVMRMQRLINRLLDFRKVQAGKAHLNLEEVDVVEFLRDIFFTFRDVAENKHINYYFTPFTKQYMMFVDKRKLDSIAYNLFSNALKYTPQKGEISVHLTHADDGNVVLEIKDSGIGIPPEKQTKLFQRFATNNSGNDSMGIGLNLSYEFAKLHHGELTYQPNPEGGSIFTLTLPTDKSVYSEDDFAVPAEQIIADAEHDKNKAWLMDYKDIAPSAMNNQLILIAEDDNDVRDYLVNELRPYFKVEIASNGQEAWQMVQEKKPDLIVSDVMMPVMSGYKLTSLVKENKPTSDIPVILLTALTDDEKRAKGFKSGADDYIQKPFSVKMLITRCTQLLSQREKLRNTYAQGDSVPQAPTVVFDSRDKKFKEDLDAWIRGNMANEQLNVDDLAQKMGYGRSTFYNKVRTLTGLTPNNYIFNVRMEAARDMLATTNFTVSEISYKIGMPNPYYFSKCFKKFSGMPPRDFRNSLK